MGFLNILSSREKYFICQQTVCFEWKITVIKLSNKFNGQLVSGTHEEPMSNRRTWPQRHNLSKNLFENCENLIEVTKKVQRVFKKRIV